MRAQISVIIPTLNAANTIGPLLASLGGGLAVGLIRELIISDGGSSDDMATIADMAGAELIVGAAGRGGQLIAGSNAAKGEWLLFIHADSHLSPGWAETVLDHLSTEITPAYFRLSFDAQGFAPRWVAGWANLRSRVFGLPYGDQALLIRRVDYQAVGGFPDIPLMEDVALVRKLPKISGLNATITTSALRYQKIGWLRRGLKNVTILIRYFLGADPEKLARIYRR